MSNKTQSLGVVVIARCSMATAAVPVRAVLSRGITTNISWLSMFDLIEAFATVTTDLIRTIRICSYWE